MKASPELRAFALPAAAVAALLLPVALAGLTLYWGDLTYIHHAWRAAPAQLVQAGRAPLWEPSLYFGLPMLGSMQGGLLYPATALFYVFGFETAVLLFQAWHLLLGAALALLWLRSLRLSWGAAASGAVLYTLGGWMVSRLPFLNHLAAAAWMPALLLLFSRPLPLALALALMFLAGYPTMVAGACVMAWALAAALRGPGAPRWPRAALVWAGAGALALALSGAQLLPGVELFLSSKRGAGVPLAESLQWGFSPADLLQWVSPLLLSAPFRPEVEWWKCVYLGLAAAAAALAGAAALPRRRALGVGLWLAAVVLLTLGGSNALSAALWEKLTPLRFLRYPGNLAYLAWPAAALLAGAGLRGKRAPLWALAIAVELVVFARVSTPLTPRGLYTEKGPLVPPLQRRLSADGTRYLLSPRALESGAGADVRDWKARLYGLTNAPFRLRAAANFGEPLVPGPSYAVMDALLSAPSADAAAAWMPWIGAPVLLTPQPAESPRLRRVGTALWEVSELDGRVSTAYLLDAEQERLAGPLAFAPPAVPTRPLAVERPREDKLSVAGEGEGWLYLAEPRYPGWSATLEADGLTRPAFPRPALGAFQLYTVPPGPWRLTLRYDPASFRWGLLLSAAALLALGAYWYHRLPRVERL